MRRITLGVALVAACVLGLAGCGSNSVELDTKSTVRFDSTRDPQPQDMGPGLGGAKGKGKGKGGAAAPP